MALPVLRGDRTPEKGRELKAAYKRFASDIKEVVSDKLVVVTSGMEGLQNMTVGVMLVVGLSTLLKNS